MICLTLYSKLKRKHKRALLFKVIELHHTDTESFWELLRQVKGEGLQNQHEFKV